LTGPDATGLLEALRTAGLAREAEAVAFTPLAGGVSADVFLASFADGRRYAVKRSIPKLRVAEVWRAPTERAAAEVRWLRLAREIDPRLAPEVVAEVPEARVFVMVFLEPADHPVWKDELAAGRIDPAFAARVGADIVRIHHETAGRADVAAQFSTNAFFFALRISPFLLRAAERHADVAPRLRAMAQDLSQRRIALVHGDVSPKNILVGPRGPVFLDAETCVYGDPAFDFAFCLTHLMLKSVWLKSHRRALETVFDAFAEAYYAGIDWEPRADLATRAAGLVAGLLLARVDGKSPAPYLTDEADRAFVRAQAKAFLVQPDLTLPGLRAQWRETQRW
jgi:aminoglycoside phosphotransferase (APT) family kinase protein